MAPMVHGLEVEYYGKIDFHYLDADAPETRDWQRELGFRYQPEFYLLDGSGKVVKKWIGYVNADSFRAEFNGLLGQ
jgi:thioredoxin-related protein